MDYDPGKYETYSELISRKSSRTAFQHYIFAHDELRQLKTNPRTPYRHERINEFLEYNLLPQISSWTNNLPLLLDIRGWELETLLENKDAFFRPQIILEPFTTTKENLSIRWYPKSHQHYHIDGVSNFRRYIHDAIDYDYFKRPENELVFIKKKHLIDGLFWDQKYVRLAIHITNTIHQLYAEIFEFLNIYFQVTKEYDFEVVTKKEKIVGWQRYNIAKREQENSDIWLKTFGEKYGISPMKFLETIRSYHGYNRDEKASKKFKSIGINLTPKPVSTIFHRIKTFHPELITWDDEKEEREWYKKREILNEKENKKYTDPKYLAWNDITPKELEKLVWSRPTTELAKEFGISGTAIAKKCKTFSITKPKPGFWAKVAAGKIKNPKGNK